MDETLYDITAKYVVGLIKLHFYTDIFIDHNKLDQKTTFFNDDLDIHYEIGWYSNLWLEPRELVLQIVSTKLGPR